MLVLPTLSNDQFRQPSDVLPMRLGVFLVRIPPTPCDDYCHQASDWAIMAEDLQAFQDRFREAPTDKKTDQPTDQGTEPEE